MEATTALTGMRVLEKPEWTDVRFGNSFRITVRVIGDRIVHSEQRGSIALPELRLSLALIERVVRETIGTRRPHVHIADYTDLKSASSDARQFFLKYMGTARNLIGVVFYGASPTLKMSIKLGRRLHLIRANLELAETFEAAMERAQEMLRRPVLEQRRAADQKGDQDRFFPGGLLVIVALGAQHVAVIRGVNKKRVLGQPGLFDGLHQVS